MRVYKNASTGLHHKSCLMKREAFDVGSWRKLGRGSKRFEEFC